MAAIFATHEAGRAFVRRHVAAGEAAFVAMWETDAGDERDRFDTAWLADSRGAMLAALVVP